MSIGKCCGLSPVCLTGTGSCWQLRESVVRTHSLALYRHNGLTSKGNRVAAFAQAF